MGSILQKLLFAALLLLPLQHGSAKMMSKAELRVKQHAAAERFALSVSPSSHGSVKNITFKNPKASGIL